MLTFDQLRERLGATREEVYEQLLAGKIPAPLKQWGPPRWDEQEIERVKVDQWWANEQE